MDQVVGSKNPAVGANITMTGSPEPYVVPGKIGNAVFLPNNVSSSRICMSMDVFTNRCVDNSSLCTKGWTAVFWHKVTTLNCSGSYVAFVLLANHNTIYNRYEFGISNIIYIIVNVPPYKYQLTYSTLLFHEVWYHWAMTFDGNAEIKFYLNGCFMPVTKAITPLSTTIQSRPIWLGCREDRYLCSRSPYDDLYIWETEKSAQFIWQLYSSA